MNKIMQSVKSFIKNDNPQAKIKWSLYGRVWNEVGKPYWKWLALGIVCTIVAAGAEAFSITLVRQIIDQGFVERNIESLYGYGLQIIAAFGAKSVFGYSKTLAMSKAGLLGALRLRRRLYNHMLGQPLGYFHNSHTGKIINYFTGLAHAVLGLVTDNIINMVQNVATLVMMVGLMVWYAPQMTLVLLFLVPAILVPLTIITRKRRVVARSSFGADANSITHISQSIHGIRTIQSFVAEDAASASMDGIEQIRYSVGFKSAKLSGLQSPLLEIMISIGLCISLMVGGHLITSGGLTTGDFAAFILALTAAYKPAKSLTSVGGGIQSGLIAAEGLFDFLDRKPEIVDDPDAAELKRGDMEVKLDNVSFAYNLVDGPVLHNVSLDVKPGKVYAFVGPSGGGKSTIFNLLDRFYDPQQGRVLINGADIRKYTLASLRGNIAAVSQDVFLFQGSIAENIKFGTPDATQEQIEAAAKAANAHDFIMGFPSKYDNQVGEFGVMLSGGQKQRIAIARAILKNAPILLLDEATSALDTQSEKLIQSALKKLMKGRTTFVIAHRLTTILDADVICVVKEGRIVEQGTDAELSALDGEYKKLKDNQIKSDKKPAAKAPKKAA